jgi:hypothetical protein
MDSTRSIFEGEAGRAVERHDDLAFDAPLGQGTGEGSGNVSQAAGLGEAGNLRGGVETSKRHLIRAKW